jgi:predicted enzyme related to lactoylglutathione lyase
MTARINYVELPVGDLSAATVFYETAFDWQLTGFGPTYAATTNGVTDIGFQADASEARPAPLPVIGVDDIDAALDRVSGAGGTIIEAIFAFPGGRRFHFLDPAGNELAVAQYD